MKPITAIQLACRLSLGLPLACADPGPLHEITETDSQVTLLCDGASVFQYNKTATAEAKRHAAFYSRSGYIHPLYTPSGKVVSGDYEPDHPHQHGLFFAWTKSRFRGEPTEFWNQKKLLGDVRFSEFRRETGGVLRFEKIYTTGKDSDEPILRESWLIEPGETTPNHFQFDLTSIQESATEDPLLIEKYHYGGMAIRGSGQWLPLEKGGLPRGQMLTSEGQTREDGNHSRPRWVALHGQVESKPCGVVVMNHPDNFRHPQWVRLHPAMPYFVFAPMVEAPFSIMPGQPYVSRFRIVTFDGEPDVTHLESIWENFAKAQGLQDLKSHVCTASPPG